jgi:hypothetical protein
MPYHCQTKSKAHNKENQRNNSQYSSLAISTKDSSFTRLFKELQPSADHLQQSLNSSELSGKDESLLLQSLELNESPLKEQSNS